MFQAAPGGLSTRQISFSLQEAIGLLVSARLMLRHADKADAHTAAAYEKLAAVLPEPLRQPLANAAFGLSTKPMNPTYSRVFGAIAMAWADRRHVDMRYQSEPDKTRRIWP